MNYPLQPANLVLIASLVACMTATATAQQASVIAPADRTVASAGASKAHGKPYKHRMSFPVGALAYFPGANLTMTGDGLDWNGPSGGVTLTVRRPLDYSGGSVRVTLFHMVRDDTDGDIAFGVSPVAFNHGNVFETYGGVSTNAIAAPLTPGVLLEHSGVIPPTGLGPFGTGNWWYIRINRNGSFAGNLRLMSVSLDY